VFGRDADDVHADLAILSQAGIDMPPLTTDVGNEAGRLRARHYHRGKRAVSLADCIAAATALTQAQPLTTSDPARAALVRDEDGEVHGLPDSHGRTP
jgi:predicted nucleic acid-binding protein